jgi:hypothetical protein
MTTTFTDDGRAHLDRYLHRLRLALSSQLSVDVSDVERDIISHIDAELAGEPQPIGAQRLTAVLDRLGPPDRWMPVDDVPAGGQTIDVARSGAEWRLPAVILTLFVLGIFLFMRMILWPVPLLLMLVSVFTARAWLSSLGQERGEIGAKRWFVYPPLVTIYALLASVLIAWPVSVIAGVMTDDPAMRDRMVGWFNGRVEVATPFVAFGALGAWWLLLGPVLYRFRRALGRTFSPFADWFERRHALWMTLAGAMLAGGSAAFLYLLSH